MATPNQQQLQAINHVYGPMRVLAGPGTGKTQILANRIIHLLQHESDIKPHEILCLTFTDAGRIAMRNRLNTVVGAAVAQKIAIHTFHSFCNEVIQNNLKYFKREELEQVTELEQLDLIKTILDKLPVQHLLRNPKNPYKSVKSLLYLFSNLKKENLSTVDVIHAINQYLAVDIFEDVKLFYQKKYKEKKAGDPKEAYFKKIEQMEKTKAAVSLMDDYKQALLDANRYDFDDMIQWVIAAFATHDELLFDYAERYQYILVDEFQDTNGSQNKLIETICSVSGQSPNLFVVGDDDQSIYRFQGANKQNMAAIETLYGDEVVTVTLQTNYRSSQEILDLAEQFIKHNTDTRLKQNFEGLQAYNGTSAHLPELVAVQNERHEYVYLATEIEKLLNQGVAPEQIAVLFTKNKYCLQLGKYLDKIGIEFQSKTTENLLELSFAKKLFAILRYINLELEVPHSGDGLLFQILHYPFFDIQSHEIAKLTIAASSSKDRQGLRAFIANAVNDTDYPISDNMRNTFQILETLIALGTSETVFVIFKKIVQQCNVHAYILKNEYKIDYLGQLTAIFEFIELESGRDKSLDLKKLMEILFIMSDNELKIPYTSCFGNDNSVQLLTIHSSKGLEFEHVFIAGGLQSNWESKKGFNNNFSLPPNLQDDIKLKNQGGDENDTDLHELRRLMYVALTRAKKQVYLSYAKAKNDAKPLAPSSLLTELFGNIEQAHNYSADTATLSRFEPVDLLLDEAPKLKALEKSFVDNQLKNYSLSATALNNYLDCPLKFYFRNILRMPDGISENASFGSAIHHAFEQLFKEMLAHPAKLFPPLEFFIESFEKNMFARRANFTKDGYEQKLDYGRFVLEQNYATKIDQWSKNVEIEWDAKTIVMFNNVPLTGFIDKVEIDGNHCNVIDYKTGNFSSKYTTDDLKGITKKRDDTYTKGGHYWRQGVFYKILIDNCGNDWKVTSATFEFVEPTKPDGILNEKKFVISPEEVAQVSDQIASTYENIMAHQFYVGCGDEKCESCGFVREHGLVLGE
jgi:DNA helicase II / ATP-dependent DNA helicase PcrA